MLTIEFVEAPPPTRCECCGGTTTTLTRLVHENGDPYAIYYARFSDNHPQQTVSLAVGLGDGGVLADPNSRTAFALELRYVNGRFEVMVVDRERCPWKSTVVLGRMRDREEALEHPRIREIFHITDRIVAEDLVIRNYFRPRTHDV